MQRIPRLAMMMIHGLDHFADDLLALLPAAAGWDVRKFLVTGPASLDAALAWTDDPSRDAIWFEFCWPPFPAMIGSTDFAGRRVIVRVHRVEATETPHVANTPWEKVDDVVVVSPDMAQRVRVAAIEIAVTSRLHLICNGVDTDRFVQTGDWDPFSIGWCGVLGIRKNPTLALQVLARLHATDTRYHLHLCGLGCDPFTLETLMHLARRLDLDSAISWEGRVAPADMPAWHAANGVLLHTSLHEGLCHAVLEAAASGCDLVVLDHPGAAACWPAEILFGAVDEAAAMIRAAQPGRWRAHVESNFTLQRQIAALSAMLNNQAAVVV